MQLPDFSEFIDSINEEKLSEMIGDAIGIRIVKVDGLFDGKNFNELMKFVMEQSVEVATEISVAYLQTYHEWIRKQIEP